MPHRAPPGFPTPCSATPAAPATHALAAQHGVPECVTFHFAHALLGTAVGDALGLPRENLSRRRIARLLGPRPLRHAFLFRFGMVSDDTEHAVLTAQSLLSSGGDPDLFSRHLARRLRLWFLSLPPGVGLATARACIKLLLGFPATKSGVPSAGNGPAMRAPVIGLYARHDTELLLALTRASTQITHTHPDAEHGALAIALAAASTAPGGMGVSPMCRDVPMPYPLRTGETPVPLDRLPSVENHFDPEAYLALLRTHLKDAPTLPLLERAVTQGARGEPFESFLASLNLNDGISGYINHTVPAVLFCWAQHPKDYRTAVEQIIRAGGDADSTAAIVGALVAARAPDSLPQDWLDNLKDFPITKSFLRTLGADLDRAEPGTPSRPPKLFWPATLTRNLFFLLIVLLHAARRALPPY